MNQLVRYVGMDVHKNTVAVAEDSNRGEVREHGKIANTPAALTNVLGDWGRTSHLLGSGSVICSSSGGSPLRVSRICPHSTIRGSSVLYRVSQGQTLH